MQEGISKDRSLQNAIIDSTENPRHCLYFREPADHDTIAKTLVNSNETYELEVLQEYETSVHSHEQFHVISSSQTQFKRWVIIDSIAPLFKVENTPKYPIRIVSHTPTVDFLLLYNSEIIPFLEAYATLFQCRLKETPTELRENIMNDLNVRKPALYGLLIDLEDVFEKVFEKGKSQEPNISGRVFALIANLIFSTPDITRERVFDRYRLLRDLRRVPGWATFREIAGFLRDYLHENGHNTIHTALGSAEGVVDVARFFVSLKELAKDTSLPEEFIFGVLSEIDIMMGRISYFCEDLESLEGKRIKHCYLGDLQRSEHFLSGLAVLSNNIDELLRSDRYSDYRQSLLDLRRGVHTLMDVKKRVFLKCPGSPRCEGEPGCILVKELTEEVNHKLLESPGN
jgi:hypothetical protein